MICRQVKQRMARVKLHTFFFHLKIVKMKKIFIILALKQPNSEERIFALYRYSRRLLARTVSLKFLSNNLSLWLSWLATSYQILIFSNLILQNFILVSKSNSPVYNKFTRHEQVLTRRVNLLYNEHWTDKQKCFYVILLF